MTVINRLTEGFLTVFGDLKVYRWPMFLIYDPGGYEIKGPAVREVMNAVRPGDILVRGYKTYLDSYFIPGYFNHAGLYLGEVAPRDLDRVRLHAGRSQFRAGEQMVIHALAEGVLMEDLLNFCRCDYMAVLRFPQRIQAEVGRDFPRIPRETYTPEEQRISSRLEEGKPLRFEEIFPVIFDVALANLGRPYDFHFDFADFRHLCCTEFVYFCTKSLGAFLGIEPLARRVLLVKKKMVIPDAFVRSGLELVWRSPTADQTKLGELRRTPEGAEREEVAAQAIA